MAEHLLYCPQIGSAFEQMGGKRMAQSVRAHILRYSSKQAQLLDYIKYHHPCEHSATAVQEQYVATPALHLQLRTVTAYILLYLFKCHTRYRHKPLLAPFSLNYDILFIDIHLRHSQPYKFTHTQPAAIKCFDDGTVALSLGFVKVDGGNHGIDLLYCQHCWQLAPKPWRLDEHSRIVVDISLNLQKLIKRLYPRQYAGLRLSRNAQVEQSAEETVQVALGGISRA